MLVSELIAELQKIIANHGDIEVASPVWGKGAYHLSHDGTGLHKLAVVASGYNPDGMTFILQRDAGTH